MIVEARNAVDGVPRRAGFSTLTDAALIGVAAVDLRFIQRMVIPVYVLNILALIALNGVLSLSELAIVSSREARLKSMARGGSRGAQVALDLANDPGKLLSAVQIGITLIGILAGAYSGSTLGGPVGQRLVTFGLDPETAADAGFWLVIILLTAAPLVLRGGKLFTGPSAIMRLSASALSSCGYQMKAPSSAASNARRRRSSLSCRADSARRRSVTSKPSQKMPVTTPFSSLIGA